MCHGGVKAHLWSLWCCWNPACCKSSSAAVTLLTFHTAEVFRNTAGGHVSSLKGVWAILSGGAERIWWPFLTFPSGLEPQGPHVISTVTSGRQQSATLVKVHLLCWICQLRRYLRPGCSRLLSHCCSPSPIMTFQTGSVLRASLAHLNTAEDVLGRYHKVTVASYSKLLSLTTSLWRKSTKFCMIPKSKQAKSETPTFAATGP